MAEFAKYAPPTEPEVHGVQVRLLVRDTGAGLEYEARFDFDIVDSANNGAHLEYRTGDLVPYLTDTQKQAFKAFLDAMLSKARDAVVKEDGGK